ERCEIYSNAGYGVHVYSGVGNTTKNIVVRYNVIHDNSTSDPSEGGIVLSRGDGNQAYMNIVYGNKVGIDIGSGGGTTSNTLVANNTISGNSDIGIFVSAEATATILQNNISYNNTPTNITSNAVRGQTTLVTNLTTNPSFVNPTTHDYSLKSTSAAI